MNKSIYTLVLTLCLTMTAVPLAAQTAAPVPLPDNVPELLVKTNEAFAAKDYLTFRRCLQRLHQLRPYNSEYMFQLVIAYALLDEKSQAYELMLRMQQQGLAYDFTSTDKTMNLRDTQVFGYVNDLMMMSGQPVGESEPVFTLPDELFMPETIEWDESRQKFLVGTVVEGQILAVGKDGQVSELLRASNQNGMWAVFDILVDQPRNRLWVTSAASRKFARYDVIDKGRSALFEFELESLELVRRHPVPVDGLQHSLGSMAQNANGDILIVDRALPIVYRKILNERKLHALISFKDMISMRGIAMQPDGRIFYLADREMGIMVVDLVAERANRLGVPETLNLGGIDGLYLWQNHLIVIQNGIQPQRVMRLQLDSSGTQVVGVRPLAVAQPEFDYPSYGTLLGDDFFYFANSQWMDTGAAPKPVTVMQTPLDSSADLVPPDMQKFLENQEKFNQAERDKAAQKKDN